MVTLIDNNKAVEISIREWDADDSMEPAYIVDDVDYCIEQANDMVAGIGDFAECGPQPNTFVDVTELDRSAYPAL